MIISVIIPVRNEAKHILNLLQDLEKQTLSPTLFEVWLIDDASEDDTAQIAQNFLASYKLTVLPSDKRLAQLSPKKRAIQTALAHTAGKLIVCTDGDCSVQKDWLRLFAEYQEATGAHWISGGVSLGNHSHQNLWGIWQSIEFSSLVGSGATTLLMGFPTMANGANLAYTREAFEAVGGFSGNEHLASGDDEFLLHKIAKQFPQKVFFLKNPLHTVFTYPQNTWAGFYAQRKRWGSKWSHYQNMSIKLLAIAIFGANLAWILSIVLFALGWFEWTFLVGHSALKLIPEYILLQNFAHYFGLFPQRKLQNYLLHLPFVQLTYPFYVVFFGVVSLGGKSYIWKGRKLQ